MTILRKFQKYSFLVLSVISLILLESQSSQANTTRKTQTLNYFKQAQARLSSGKYEEARRFAKKIISDQDFEDYGLWIYAQSSLSQSIADLSKNNLLRAFSKAQEAEAYFFKLFANHSYSPFVRWLSRDIALAEIAMGMSLCHQKKIEACLRQMENGFQRLVLGSELGFLKMDPLRIYLESCSQLKTELCLQWVQKFSLYYSKASIEYRTLLDYFPDETQKQALSIIPKISQSYKSPDYDQLAFEQLVSRFFEKKFDDAKRAYEKFQEEFPKSTLRFRARFWMGLTFQKLGKKDDATKMFQNLKIESPLGFYGLLSAFTLESNLADSFASVDLLGNKEANRLLPYESLKLKRAELLLKEDLTEFAALELKGFRPRDSFPNDFLIYIIRLCQQAGAHAVGFIFINELIQRGWDGLASTWILRAVFPVAYYDLIQKVAAETGLDPILILSLVKQESAFDSMAVSSSGALGLMQLMPFTAVEVEPEIPRSDILNVEINIRLGARYLAKLMNRFKGNIALSLAAYNAGPNAVDRWLNNENSKKGILEFIESIPYRETREYVSTIIRNCYWYSYLLKKEIIRGLDPFWKPMSPPS